ncbi:MAG: prepilin-type N-terminal cleavage/methylation domain-containing protein [bacterium]|nr:prepilin-type N-terminal cleavage/methylation domain-containing protein [bacterium]
MFTRHKKAASFSREGFTLIELLVVIAIIALLSGILFPVFTKSRMKAKQATCINNLKQCGMAFSMYAQDYDGLVPYYAYDGKTTNLWSTMLYNCGYAKSTSIFACPAQDPYSWSPGGLDKYIGYGINERQIRWHPSVLNISGPGSANWRYFDMYNVAKPAQFMMLADSISVDSASSTYFKKQYWLFYPDPTGAGKGLIHMRHNGLADLLFADGHVAACDKAAIKNAFLAEKLSGTNKINLIQVAEEDGTVVSVYP